MSDRKNFYFEQTVMEDELDEAFDDLENSLWNFVVDIGIEGIVVGLSVSEADPTPNLTVEVQPGECYNDQGKRIRVPAEEIVNCALDYLGASTIPSAGNSRYISLFAAFERNLSDPRTDGNGDTVYFEVDESFEIHVYAGTETTGTPTPPSLVANKILLCDIRIYDTTTAITDAMIDVSRKQIGFNFQTGGEINGNTTVNGDITVGNIDGSTITTSGDGEIGNDLNVVNDLIVGGSFNFGSILDMQGNDIINIGVASPSGIDMQASGINMHNKPIDLSGGNLYNIGSPSPNGITIDEVGIDTKGKTIDLNGGVIQGIGTATPNGLTIDDVKMDFKSAGIIGLGSVPVFFSATSFKLFYSGLSFKDSYAPGQEASGFPEMQSEYHVTWGGIFRGASSVLVPIVLLDLRELPMVCVITRIRVWGEQDTATNHSIELLSFDPSSTSSSRDSEGGPWNSGLDAAGQYTIDSGTISVSVDRTSNNKCYSLEGYLQGGAGSGPDNMIRGAEITYTMTSMVR